MVKTWATTEQIGVTFTTSLLMDQLLNVTKNQPIDTSMCSTVSVIAWLRKEYPYDLDRRRI